MSYPFVPAHARFGPRKGPVRAFLVHFAEGGGTVGFLSRPNPRNVSVHYVIEKSGRIVQMVRESDATGSVNPNDIRTTDDSDGFFGVTVAKATMGGWHKDPNSAVISLEIEGFAKDGPNNLQARSLRALISDVRSRFPDMGLLGHRDFTSRKACPGKLIPWSMLGGHGPKSTAPSIPEENMQSFTWGDDVKLGNLTVKGPGHSYLRLAGHGSLHPIADGVAKRAMGRVTLVKGIGNDTPARREGYLINLEAAFVLATDCVFVADVTDTPAAVKAALDHVQGPAAAVLTAIQEARL